jgi:hypothetical protein
MGWKEGVPYYCSALSIRFEMRCVVLSNGQGPWPDIQGDSGGICNTLGNDSMCNSKQKKFV